MSIFMLFLNFGINSSKIEQNLVKFDDDKILLTEKGMLFADSISENLFLI